MLFRSHSWRSPEIAKRAEVTVKAAFGRMVWLGAGCSESKAEAESPDLHGEVGQGVEPAHDCRDAVGPMPSCGGRCSPSIQPGKPRDTPDEERIDWRAVSKPHTRFGGSCALTAFPTAIESREFKGRVNNLQSCSRLANNVRLVFLQYGFMSRGSLI